MKPETDNIKRTEADTRAVLARISTRMKDLTQRERFKGTADLAAVATDLTELSALVTRWQTIATNLTTKHS